MTRLDRTHLSASRVRLRLCATLASLLLLGACGGSASEGREPTVRIKGPDIEPRPAAVATLEPGATPSPSPSPAPVTPTPEPTPTPVPLAAPRGASIRSASGTQPGAPGSFCWTSQSGGGTECQEHPPPSQPSPLVVRHGEVVLLVIDADRAPSEESIRPFQGTREGFPAQRIDAALETELAIELSPGEWSMDLCATWHGHGQPVCWLFGLQVDP